MVSMDRKTWLREKRRSAEFRYDTIFAKEYDAKWGEISSTHRRVLESFLNRLPLNAEVLDAACGTGKYWGMMLDRKLRLMAIDQSGEMLRVAKEKYPLVPVQKLGLQEMDFTARFAGITCIDAMEFIPPDDWPMVMKNFGRALSPDGLLYFTVEIAGDAEIREAFDKGKQRNLPLVMGEDAYDVGYHYYPPDRDVVGCIEAAHFTILSRDSGDYYNHFIVQKNYRLRSR